MGRCLDPRTSAVASSPLARHPRSATGLTSMHSTYCVPFCGNKSRASVSVALVFVVVVVRYSYMHRQQAELLMRKPIVLQSGIAVHHADEGYSRRGHFLVGL